MPRTPSTQSSGRCARAGPATWTEPGHTGCWPTLRRLSRGGVAKPAETVGLQWTSATEGTLIQGMSPLMTLALASVLVGEQIRRWQVVGGLTAFGGLAVLLLGGSAGWGGGSDRLLGNLVVFGACICWSS